MKNELSSYVARPKRYNNIDGTGEVFMGLMFAAYALVAYLQRHVPQQSFWSVHGVLLMYAVLFPVLGIGFLFQKLVKCHITFPRTGYAAVGHPEKSTQARGVVVIALLSGAAAAVVAMVMVSVLRHGREYEWSFEWARLAYGAIFIGAYAFWITRMGQGHRWKWILFSSQFIAVVVLASTISDGGGLSDWFYPRVMVIASATWIVSGTVTLFVYLREHQLPCAQ